MEIGKLTCMQGGDGPGSYARNSGPQNVGFHAYAKAHLVEAIQLYKENNAICFRDKDKQNEDHVIQVMSPRCIRIADYGCGYGRNTVEYAQFIVSKLLELHEEEDELMEETAQNKPEFMKELQYYFVDLPSDDFNNLFCMLHDLDFATIFEGSLKFFCAGVPRSFYDHVLPEGSVDFAITTYALHWLSQVPAVLLDKNALTWNEGHVWIPIDDGGAAAAAVSEAYAKQFQEDARKFLRNRAEEMRSNGILFILSTCHAQEMNPSDHVSRCHIYGGYFEQAWNELVEQGIVEAWERDTFNVPYYNFSRIEFEEAVESVTDLELLELHVLEKCDHIPSPKIDDLLSHPPFFGEFWSSFLRSLTQPLVDAHIGKTRAVQLFDRLQVIATENRLCLKNLVCDLLIAIIRKK